MICAVGIHLCCLGTNTASNSLTEQVWLRSQHVWPALDLVMTAPKEAQENTGPLHTYQ